MPISPREPEVELKKVWEISIDDNNYEVKFEEVSEPIYTGSYLKASPQLTFISSECSKELKSFKGQELDKPFTFSGCRFLFRRDGKDGKFNDLYMDGKLIY